MLRIISMNLNGIRSAWSKGAESWLKEKSPDIVCFQELKAQLSDLSTAQINPDGYYAYYHCAEKKGYSGVGLWSRKKPLQVLEGIGNKEFDAEGRYIQADFERYSVISVYIPSGSSSQERQEAKFRFLEVFFEHLRALRAGGKEIIICGDWNIAHKEIDLKNWKSNQKNSGFLPEERAWFSDVLEKLNWVDVYRSLYPDQEGEAYTWWSNRGQAWAKNVGWRIDYHMATPGIAGHASRGEVFKGMRFSDHAPLIMEYDVEVEP